MSPPVADSWKPFIFFPVQVSIVTSLFNRLDLTRPFLESLERTLRGWEYEIILIDDVSTDGTREFLAGLTDPRYRIICNDTPGSFASNNNTGARLARAPLLCFLNNDIVLLPGWLEPMAQLARLLPDVGCVGNVQREPVSGLLDHCGIYFDAEGQAIHAGKNDPAPPAEPYLSWPAVTAACWVVRKAVFLQLGGFDEAFRNGSEDLDFCLRAAVAGYRHFTANRSVIYHHVSASPGRKQHEDNNRRLFRERWQPWIADAARVRITADKLRQDGRRYLRKHLARPWRYNLWRFCAALENRWFPRPASREPEAFARWWLRAGKMLAGFARKEDPASPGTAGPATRVFLVVGNAARDAGHAGAPTLVRSLAAAFGRLDAPVRLVTWNAVARNLSLLPLEFSLGCDAEALRAPSPSGIGGGDSGASLYDARAACLHDPCAANPALHEIPSFAAAPNTWVLMPEVMHGKEEAAHLTEYVHQWGWRLAVIFHDAIPFESPQFAAPGEPVQHSDYMRFFSEADLILPVSATASRQWEEFVHPRGFQRPPVVVCAPGGDTCVHTRRAELPIRNADAPVRILSVSTVGARKNQRALLNAYDLAVAARTDLRLELTLIGASRPSADNFPAAIHEAMARHPGNVHWIERADYSALRSFYEAADFTVYPSEMEGFGLPILESLWFGCPCVCANFGAMGETAAGGGCLTVDVRDPNALADAMVTLAGSEEYRSRIAAEARERRVRTWNEYAMEILANLSKRDVTTPAPLFKEPPEMGEVEDAAVATMSQGAGLRS